MYLWCKNNIKFWQKSSLYVSLIIISYHQLIRYHFKNLYHDDIRSIHCLSWLYVSSHKCDYDVATVLLTLFVIKTQRTGTTDDFQLIYHWTSVDNEMTGKNTYCRSSLIQFMLVEIAVLLENLKYHLIKYLCKIEISRNFEIPNQLVI